MHCSQQCVPLAYPWVGRNRRHGAALAPPEQQTLERRQVIADPRQYDVVQLQPWPGGSEGGIKRVQGERDACASGVQCLADFLAADRKSTRLNSSHQCAARMPSSALKKKMNNTIQ